jgi:CO dehydrogenase maturation factor
VTLTLAVVGKGGVGKTLFAALTIKYLRDVGRTPILAIDADPSSNLNLALGMELRETVGQIREDAAQQVSTGTFQVGIAKPDWFDYQVNDCLVEGDDIDLLAMGRPEGPGCYCAANNILRLCIDRLGNDYAAVVIDNEAGMEHISRQTTRRIDRLFVLTDPTQRGLAAAEHIMILARDLNTRIGSAHLVINNVAGDLPEPLATRAREVGIPLLGVLPRDPAVGQFDVLGRPLVELGDASLVYPAVKALLARALSS